MSKFRKAKVLLGEIEGELTDLSAAYTSDEVATVGQARLTQDKAAVDSRLEELIEIEEKVLR
jgi:hypothetical protein